ncbi:DNA-binding SARP family transcriptional activator/predicted ATPase [Sedimentibacter acidaminivorans]|uniref:DNA-binding SARP family transcriptional activator/predicted ATPase n=1 Tax=Sedimentibacter acidaminivorans TaxID=913099 RepID=A0ABS4GEN1_9FIRM|nr:AAA family ATPase [Sedimentibacter acidaminivorans]MBP1926109.1 DNA-binding SARP family transcriptional activator/predicted ATPase [Sedimentibacter acidaminivorans]
MKNILVLLLGDPIVKFNNKEVYFPYKKSEGLFYYVCINKKITREEAINIFWADNDETSARKNLRDAIYKIKKTLCDDIFSSVSKSVIEFNSDINIEIDIDSITPSNIINKYTGDFLGNFLIKNCYDFENWVSGKKEEYKKIYTNSVSKKVNELVNIGDFKSIQKYSNILIDNDPYNEKTYRYLMKIYALSGDYNKAIKLYYDLTDILKRELDIGPEPNSKKMFKEILKLKDTSIMTDDSKVYFYGRYNELYAINNNINNFLTTSGTSMLITGEAGIGKTSLINKIILSLNVEKNIVLRSVCYNAEEDFFLKPWHSIFSILGNYVKSEKIHLSSAQEQIISYVFPTFNNEIMSTKFDNIEQIDTTRYEIAVDAIIHLLEKLSDKKNIIFVFDDLQWMDKMSRLLLSNIVFHFKNKKVLFIGAYRDDFENTLSSFIVPLASKDLITKIKLHRFSFEETRNIVSEFLSPNSIDNNLITNIYNDTEGNALFLIELLKVVKEKGYTRELSSKATNIIKSRIMDLTKDEKTLLNNISLFFDKVSIDCLKILVSFDELYIFDIIESLQEKHLIQELITDKDIFYSFTHQKIREYIYECQSVGKKNILHEKIGLYFEECFKSSGNKYLYANLIYHFEKCGNVYKALKYKVENLTNYYTVYHETYPVFYSKANYFTESEDIFSVEQKLSEISKELNNLSETDTEFLKIKMEVSYLSGRYYISTGEYEIGLKKIDSSMRIAEKLENNIYLLNNYKQMIFYCIQVNDIPVMYKYINKSLKLLEKNDNIEERGTILRLKGLYYIKTKKYDDATKLLNESLVIFSSLNQISNKYTLSISACYNYLGQMNKGIGNYNIAYDYFKQSIDLCTENEITKGLDIFYSNLGQVLYEMKKYEESEEYIYKSISLFKKNGTIWGRDIAECYAAMIELNKKNVNEAYLHYKKASEFAKKINNPKSLILSEKVRKLLI